MLTQDSDEVVTLEQIKNQITMGEAEVKRLKDLRVSEEATIAQLVKDKRWHEEEVERLQGEEKVLEQKLATLDEQCQEKQKVIDAAADVKRAHQTEWDKLAQAKAEHEDNVAARHTELKDREQKCAEREQTLDLVHQRLAGYSDELNAKKDRIINFAESLKE